MQSEIKQADLVGVVFEQYCCECSGTLGGWSGQSAGIRVGMNLGAGNGG